MLGLHNKWPVTSPWITYSLSCHVCCCKQASSQHGHALHKLTLGWADPCGSHVEPVQPTLPHNMVATSPVAIALGGLFFFYKTMDTVFPQLDTEATTALLQARWISPSSVRVPDEGGSVHVPALGQVTVSSCVPSSVAACFCLCKQLSKTTVNVFPSLFQHEFFQNRLSNNGQKKKKKKINKGKKQPFFAAVLKFTQQFFKLWRWLQSGLWPLLLNSIVWKHAVLNLSEISYPGYYNKYKGFLYYR